jgi:hypothetical protein
MKQLLIKAALGDVPAGYNNGELNENASRLLEEYSDIVSLV